LTSSEAGPFASPAPGADLAEVPVAGGSGEAVWEVTKATPSQTGDEKFGVYVSYPAGPGGQAGTVRVAGGFAPQGAGGPIPSFAAGSGPTDIARLTPCDQSAGGAGGGGGGAGDAPSPGRVVQSLSLSPRSFRAASRGASLTAAARTGTTLSFALGRPARLTFTVSRQSTGVRSGRRCVRPGHKGTRGKKKCTLLKRLRGSFAADAPPGATRTHFTGRLRNRKLPPATYRLSATPKTAGGTTEEPTNVTFRIVR
jgi:hypothetical protein